VILDAGTLSVSDDANLGDPSAFGAVTLNGGTLATTATFASARPVILEVGGTFAPRAGTTLTLTGAVAGSGGLTLNGAGTLALSGDNTYSGGTLVDAGTLSVRGDANLGGASAGVTLNGGTLAITTTFTSGRAVTLDTPGGMFAPSAGTTFTMTGTVVGPGALTMNGAGTLALSGANTYTGGTSIDAGMLSVASDANLGDASGGVTFNGGTLATTATFTSARTMTVKAAGATFAPMAGTALTLSGPVTGTGPWFLSGPGTVILDGNGSGATGLFTVAQGTFEVGDAANPGASYGGGVTVQPGAALTGYGTIKGLVTNNGTVTPGGAPGIGTLTLKKGYTQGAGGTLGIEVNPTTANLLAVTGAANLAGTLALTFDPGTYVPSMTYPIVTATGGVSGTFGTVTQSGQNLGLLVPTLTYKAKQVTLGFMIDPLPDFAATSNQFAVATALQNASETATGGDLVGVLNTLVFSSPSQLQGAYTAMAGGTYTAMSTVTVDTLDAAVEAVFGHWDGAGSGGVAAARVLPTAALSGSGDPSSPTWLAGTGSSGPIQSFGTAQGAVSQSQAAGWGLGRVWGTEAASGQSVEPLDSATPGVWTQAFGGSDAVTGAGDALTSANAETSGVLAGFDYYLSQHLRFGVVVGNWQSDVTMNDGTGESAGLTTGLVAAYGRYTAGAWVIDALAGYTFDNDVVQRPLAFAGRTATGAYTANDTIGAVEVGRQAQWGALTITPTVGLDYVQTAMPGVSETGADSLNLTVAGQSVTSIRGVAGVRLAGPTGGAFAWTAYAGYGHEFGNPEFSTTATFAGAPGQPFTVTGVNQAADTWGAGLRLTWHLWDGADFHVTYDAVLSSYQTSQTGSVGLDLHF